MGARRRGPEQSPPTSKLKYEHKTPGVVRLLFETPSGFAIFSLDESYLEKDIEHIWTYFIGDFWHKNIIWLREFQVFEDRPNAINCATRKIIPSLIKMIVKHIDFEEKLAVGRPEYKEIIEELLDIPCLYGDAVKEVMWGMQNLLNILVPQELSEMPMEDRIPMSKGLDMVLRRNGFVIEPKLINEDIIRTANTMHDLDLRERAHSKFLHKLLDEDFMAISGVNAEDWYLLKIATAIKLMCYPCERILVGDPYEMFSLKDLEMIEDDAATYRDKMDENLILQIYEDVVSLYENKRAARQKLRCLVRDAKEALEAVEVLEEPATTGVNSKQHVDHTCLTVDPPEVPNQTNISEGQHSITEGKVLEKEDENSTVKLTGLTTDGYNVGKSTDDGEQARETGASTEENEKTAASDVGKKMLEKKDEDTNMDETGATLVGDIVGKVMEKEDKNIGSTPDRYNVENNTVGGKKQAPETGTGTEKHEKIAHSAHVGKNILEKKDEDTKMEEKGATSDAEIVGKVLEKEDETRGSTPDGCHVGNNTADRTDGAGTEKHEKTADGAYVGEKTPEKKDEDTNIGETGSTSGDIGGKLPEKEDEKGEEAQGTGAGSEGLEKTAGYIGQKMPEKKDKDKLEEKVATSDKVLVGKTKVTVGVSPPYKNPEASPTRVTEVYMTVKRPWTLFSCFRPGSRKIVTVGVDRPAAGGRSACN